MISGLVQAAVFVALSNTPPTSLDKHVLGVADEPVSFVTPFTDPDAAQTWTAQIVAQPGHGTVSIGAAYGSPVKPSFKYTPAAGYVGLDAFTFTTQDGTATSNVATVSLRIRPSHADFTGQTVIVVVNGALLPALSAEVARLQADLQAQGYTTKLKTWTTGSIWELWTYLSTEFRTPGQFLAGALLVGELPYASTSTGSMTDYVLMNLSIWGDTWYGYDPQSATTLYSTDIWVSRINGGAAMVQRALDVNHDYRTGASRLPSKSYYFDAINGVDNSPNAAAISAQVEYNHPLNAFLEGGDLLNEVSHGGTNYYDTAGQFGIDPLNIHNILAQVRFSFHDSCKSGVPGGVVNQQLFTRGGGNVLSVGASDTTYVGMFEILASGGAAYTAFRASVAAGDSWGNALVASFIVIDDNLRAMFWGDLSLPVIKQYPSNKLPTLSGFTADKVSGVTPLTVGFSAAASDSDGTVASYEWFLEGHDYGRVDPTDTTTAPSASHTYTLPHNYLARVEAVDNYQARAWKELDVAVLPSSNEVLRINSGITVYYEEVIHYTPGYDYTAVDGGVWLYDQPMYAGNWGYKTGNSWGEWANDKQGAPVAGTDDPELFRTWTADSQYDYSHTGQGLQYNVPLTNGTYTVKLGFADLENAAAGKRLIDAWVQGTSVLTAYDIVADVGSSTATWKSFTTTVADGGLNVMLRTNPASPTNSQNTHLAIINAVEIIPATVAPPNHPPSVALTSPAAETLMAPASIAFAATASDSDGTVAKVEFLNGTTKIGEALAPPYAFSWTGVGAGTYALAARALDNAGASTTSPAVVVTVTAPNLAPTVASPASATVETADPTKIDLSVLGADDSGESALVYTWSCPGAVFTANGTNAAKRATATVAHAGPYAFDVEIKDASGLSVHAQATVTVSPALRAIAVSPVDVNLPVGGMQTFTAAGADQFGQPLAQGAVAWAVSGGGAVSAAGVFTAATTGGPFDLTATAGGVVGRASVTVTAPNGPHIVAEASASPSPVTGTTARLSVRADDDGGAAALVFDWAEVSGPAPVSFSANSSNAAQDTTVTFAAVGPYVLRATVRDADGNVVTSGVSVAVVQTLTSLVVMPSSTSLMTGASQRFSAAGADQFGAMMPTPTLSWAVAGGGTVDADGLFAAGAAPGGPYDVTATSGGTVGHAQVLVLPAAGAAPTVALDGATQGQTLTGRVALHASVHDALAVSSVRLELDGQPAARLVTSPYDFSLDTSTFAAGAHTLEAVAVDAGGRSVRSGPVQVTFGGGVVQVIGQLGCASSSDVPALLLALAWLARRRSRR
jgi:hypothetical protein